MPTLDMTRRACAPGIAHSPRIARHCCMIALICGAAISVSSCSTTGTVPLAVQADPPPMPAPDVPESLLAPCDPMPVATDSRVPSLIVSHDSEMAMHHDCAARHARLAEAVREHQATDWANYCAAARRMGLHVDACAEVAP